MRSSKETLRERAATPRAVAEAIPHGRDRAEARYRVALVAACPFPSLRGSQVLIRELAESLCARGHAVHVVTYPTAQHIVPVRQIAIHRAPKLPLLWTTRPFGWQKLFLDLLLIVTLYRVVRRERIEIIHAHNLEGPLVAYAVRALTGVPVVYHAHNALSDELPRYARSRFCQRLLGLIGAFFDRHVAGAADFSIALTDRLASFLAVRRCAGRVLVASPAIARFERPDHPPRRDAGPCIMYAGNLDPYQDLSTLLLAFDKVAEQCRGARLDFVTHEARVERVEKLRRSIGERSAVTITVAKTFPAACRELVRADVLVCPRGSWSGFPIKVLNYMALGRPIVHSRSSAHPIEHEVTGLLCDDGDPEGLADAILRLNRDPALAERLGSAAREAALARFGWAQVIPTVLECYRRATGGPPQQPPEEPRLKMVKGKRSARPLPRGQRHRIRGYAQGPTRKSMTRIVGLLFAVYVLASIAGCAGRQVASESVAPLPPLEAPEVPVSTDTSDSYRLRPGDVVRVKFLYHPELDVKLPIRPDGSVTLQGVGELHAAGKTANELAREIEKVSAKQLRDPEVTVIVADLGPHKVYVGGEVRVPGYVLFVEGMTPLQAILDRGGFTEFARTDSVLRLTIRDQSYQATRIDLSTNISHGGADLTTLAANDVLFVPRTFIGDANAFVRNYVRGLLPVVPRAGVGIGITP